MNSVKITSGSQHDNPILRAGRWMRGKLLIFDLGYYRIELFDSIAKQQGYFLSRLKAISNPRVIDGKTPSRRGNEPIGTRLQIYLQTWDKAKPVDVEAEFYHYFPAQKNQRKGTFRHIRCRIVGQYNLQTQKYHLYVTNIPSLALSADQVVRLYSARWLIELLFRELKMNYRMGEIPSKKRHVVEALVYAALIGLLISRRFLAEIRRISKSARNKFPEERWATIWATISVDLLAITLRPYRDKIAERYLSAMIQVEAINPNRKRKLLPQRAFA